VVDQDASHHAGRDGEEVHAVLPRDIDVDEAGVRFVDESGRLEGVLLALAAHVPVGEAPELLVDDRHELVERVLVSLPPVEKQRGDRRLA
jgi:hypothetical protein